MPAVPNALTKISHRVSRADELLALQRARMCRCRGAGLDAGQALLKIMEEIAEQFRASHKIIQSCVQRGRNASRTWNGHSALQGQAPPVSVAETLSERRVRRVPRAQPAGFLCPDCGVTIGVKGEGDGTYV
jgi:hypothetical protein